MAWPFDPSVYAGLVALFLGHAWLARDRDLPRRGSLYFGLGLFSIWLALETPVETIGAEYLDSVHMVQHVLLLVIAPPLLLLGLNRPMGEVLMRLPGARSLTEPVPAQAIPAAVMIAWHVPALYDATLYWEPLHVLEHLMFLGAGVIFWWPVVESTSAHARWRLRPGGKLVYILAGTLPQDGVALVLQFSSQPFYEFYAHAPRLVPWLDPVTDQNLAGAILMFAGKTSYLVAGLAVFFRWFSEGTREDLEEVGAAGTNGPARGPAGGPPP